MTDILNLLRQFWPVLTALASFAFSVSTSVHALLYKRDSRATVAWVGMIWLVPFVGALLYTLLGINRIRRRVSGTRGEEHHLLQLYQQGFSCSDNELYEYLPVDRSYFLGLSRLNHRLTQLQLLKGNTVQPLYNGDQAYPAMIEAIDAARKSVTMTSYIFDNDAAGVLFADALGRAHDRGVEVRVLIDAVGARYSMPPISYRLRSKGIHVAHFMPTLLPWATPYINLRSHRKIMVVDGTTGFTGGMNIRFNHMVAENPPHPTCDLHFQITGPIVEQLQATFVEDWQFSTREELRGDTWFPQLVATGNILSRAIPDGPDKDFDKMRMAFMGALAVAQHSVRIMTPYFLPDSALIGALNTCALRGVTVDIVLPEHNNLKMVQWAATAQLWQLLEWGCNLWYTPRPFEHSKIMTIDGIWSLIGSANWDPRSLRLNFEFGLECYSTELAKELSEHIEKRKAQARRITLEEVNGRRIQTKLRDASMRLAAPYL